MNTAKLKKYAPQARREFITAVSKQLNQLGIYSDKQISEVKQEGSVLLIEGKTFEPSVKTARERLVKKVLEMGYNQLVEQVAYTWFNRLCAIRYMEIHDYLGHGFRVLSHLDNPKGFEIIDHAQDAADELGLDRSRIIEFKLAGNKDEELYRVLLLGQCHKLHEAMPFLFDALDDETELLLPDNLTRTDSILRGLVDGIPEEDWQQVEVIGWLYQFYISEKKDQVMGKVVKSEDIPAATQLFTPNWIVKYLVQNSVGRQWLQTYPDSVIKSQMEYYIEPAEQSDEVNQQLKAITPESIEPETIKVLDPACGSGHILIEAYNVLKAIYEERGFRSRDIPKMILENNLYGLDIDDRAAQLSGFALMMMARDDDKRIFTRNVRLNVLSLQDSNHLNLLRLWNALNLSGNWQIGTSQDLFDDEEQDLSSFNADNRYQLLKRTLARFTQAKTFGSLIDVPSDEHDQLKELLNTLIELQESGDSMQKPAAKQLIEFVHQALVLSIRYDVVIANPPYMGLKAGMNSELKNFVKVAFPNSKNDLYACFIEKSYSISKETALNAFVVMQGWMFLSTFEEFRIELLKRKTLDTMMHLGPGGFANASAMIVQTTAFIFRNDFLNDFVPTFYRLLEGGENEKRENFRAGLNRLSGLNQAQFESIPGAPVAYWVSKKLIDCFKNGQFIRDLANVKQGLATSNNDRFVRVWQEVSISKINRNANVLEDTLGYFKKWYPFNKGGEFKKWYGNQHFVVNWENNGEELWDFTSKLNQGANVRLKSRDFYFKEGVTWTDITAGSISARLMPKGFIFDASGPSLFPEKKFSSIFYLALINSKVSNAIVGILNPTLHFQPRDANNIPIPSFECIYQIEENTKVILSISKNDWDSFEYSLDFKTNPLIKLAEKNGKIERSFCMFLKESKKSVSEVKRLEEANNSIFIQAYGLADEARPELNLEEITLNTNSQFVYRNLKNDTVKDCCFQSDSIVDLISFSVGCVLGRYSLDREGLVFADERGVGFEKLIDESAYKTFPADEDGIIPLTDQDWFKDDATNRFREFVQVVWGEEHLQKNLDFVAESLCLNAIKPKKSESALETIRRYLSTQFYKDHLKTYKKRPIYWLFSSGKQKAFECLVYLHRYNEGTLSRMRTEYVTPLLGKYDAYAEQLEKQIESADSTSEANRFKKELDALIKKQVELREFDDKLKHYADMRISLDLDDGVKVNYGKFSDLLADVKAITGSAMEDN